MESTPNANRLHVAIFGVRNSGKSSLINAITGEQTSVVSAVAGTTTDSVARSIELHGVGAVLLIDTPGFDDLGEVGEQRIVRSRRTVERTDIALLLCEDGDLSQERRWFDDLSRHSIPVVLIINKIDVRSESEVQALKGRIEEQFSQSPLLLSAKNGVDKEMLREVILANKTPDMIERTITQGLVKRGDVVVLVMPQDPQAPKGRIILPQVQTLRELLDIGAMVVSCTGEDFASTLSTLKSEPKLIITDSQIFDKVYQAKPSGSMLTSFSILMAG